MRSGLPGSGLPGSGLPGSGLPGSGLLVSGLLVPYRRVAGKVLAQHDAAELLRAALAKRTQPLPSLCLQPADMNSTWVDPFGPHEASAGLSRACLRVLHELRHPVEVTTPHQLLLRDTNLLQAMAADNLVRVLVPMHSLRAGRGERACPASRLHLIHRLAGAGVPIGVLLEPRDRITFERELDALLEAARGAGARWVQLSRASPRLRSPKHRRGADTNWEQLLRQPLQLGCARLGLDTRPPALDSTGFRARSAPRQLEFFEM